MCKEQEWEQPQQYKMNNEKTLRKEKKKKNREI